MANIFENVPINKLNKLIAENKKNTKEAMIYFDERYDKLRYYDKIINRDEITVNELADMFIEYINDVRRFFMETQIKDAYKLRNDLLSYIYDNLLDEVESETEDVNTIILRSLHKYLELKNEYPEIKG